MPLETAYGKVLLKKFLTIKEILIYLLKYVIIYARNALFLV